MYCICHCLLCGRRAGALLQHREEWSVVGDSVSALLGSDHAGGLRGGRAPEPQATLGAARAQGDHHHRARRARRRRLSARAHRLLEARVRAHNPLAGRLVPGFLLLGLLRELHGGGSALRRNHLRYWQFARLHVILCQIEYPDYAGLCQKYCLLNPLKCGRL